MPILFMTLMRQSVINFILNKRINLITIKYTIGAYVICVGHIKEIKRGDLEFFNKGSKRIEE